VIRIRPNPVILGFIRKELSQALRDRRMVGLLFIAPVVQMCLFGYALRTDIRNVRLGVVATPGDRIAARIAERAYASGYFLPAAVGRADPYEDLAAGRADAVLIAPSRGFTRAIGRGAGRAQLLVDATNAVRARAVEAYLMGLAAGVLTDAAGTAPPAGPVRFDIRVLYNPTMESSIFMIPALAVLVLSLMVILTAMGLAREKELGTMEMLLSAPVSRWEILAGKTIPYVLMAFVNTPIVLAGGILWFEVPMRGAVWMVACSAFVFAIATSSIGTLISSLARNQQQAMIGGFLFMLPGMMLSGVFFPLENMPPAVYWITYFNPLRYFVTLLRNIILKGGSPEVVWPNLAAMAALAIFAAWLAVKRFRQTLN
jgi:ABC-2 type transport system permease protein